MTICENCKIKSSAAKALKPSELKTLGMNCAHVEFKKGDTIIKQDAFSSNIIYLKTGLVKVHISGPLRSQITKITRAPSFLAIPTTFDEKINQYSATAIIPTTVCFIDIEVFKNFVYKNGKFAYEIIVELCHSELFSFKKCVNRTQKNIHGRVAEALLYFSQDIYESDEFILPLSRLEFGNYVDTSRESISRILSDFDKDGIIRLNKKKITLMNKKSLKMISMYG